MTPAQIKALKHPGGERAAKFAVGGVSGLLIQVQPSGAKSWILRGRFGEVVERRDASGAIVSRERKKREIGLGAYPDILPGAAREKAREYREKIEAGVDPIAERRVARAALLAQARRGLTFRQAFDRFAAVKVEEFSSEKSAKIWKERVELHAMEELGPMLVEDIGLQDVLRVLNPIWNTKTVTANKLRGALEATLSYATVNGHRSGDNPARWRGNLQVVLASPSKVSGAKKFPAVQLNDIQRWWRDLSARHGMGADALRFQALTATRSGAVRFATWDEFDLASRIWTIQPGRTASKIDATAEAKRVPLTDEAVALLSSLPRMNGVDLAFWAPRGGALSDATLGKVMRTIHEAAVESGGKGYVDAASGKRAVPHGLRSSFRTWVSERTMFDGDMAEVALFHRVGTKVQQAYDRSEMVEKRRHMMEAWGAFIRGEDQSSVVAFGARA